MTFNKVSPVLSCSLPKNGDGSRPSKHSKSMTEQCLLRWIQFQDFCCEKNKKGFNTELTEEKIVVLDKVKFPWKLNNAERWNKSYQELSKFHAAHGNCKVPRGRGLGECVPTQRKAMKLLDNGKKSSLSHVRIDKLDMIGFEWDLHNWDAKFEHMMEFMETHGHYTVSCDQDSTLTRWIAYQREQYKRHISGKKTLITDEQIEKLEGIEFEWSVNKKSDCNI